MNEQVASGQTQSEERSIQWVERRTGYLEEIQTQSLSIQGCSYAKAQTEPNLDKDVKYSKKDYFRYIGDKRKTRKKVSP